MKHLLIPLATLAILAFADPADAEPRITGDAHRMSGSASFLSAHDDIRFRKEGLESLKDGLHEAAEAQFKHAARFADKLSQAMLAEMYWKGTGVPVDRARAYAWMDLAAERGYPKLVALREYYWTHLAPAERPLALDIGRDLYAKYGDAVAVPRMAQQLREAGRHVTGSRLGTVTGKMKVIVRGENGGFAHESGDRFYDRKFWDPRFYQDWKDASYRLNVEKDAGGTVTVGALREDDADPE